jgi:hypothetical protein
MFEISTTGPGPLSGHHAAQSRLRHLGTSKPEILWDGSRQVKPLTISLPMVIIAGNESVTTVLKESIATHLGRHKMPKQYKADTT